MLTAFYLQLLLQIYLYRVLRGRCSKIFCSVLHFASPLQSANGLISQKAKRYKYHMTKIHNRSLCYIYHMVQDILIKNSGKTRFTLKCSIDISTSCATLSELSSGERSPVFKSHCGQEFLILLFSVIAPH